MSKRINAVISDKNAYDLKQVANDSYRGNMSAAIEDAIEMIIEKNKKKRRK